MPISPALSVPTKGTDQYRLADVHFVAIVGSLTAACNQPKGMLSNKSSLNRRPGIPRTAARADWEENVSVNHDRQLLTDQGAWIPEKLLVPD
jgi:hypothetical protein